MADETSSGAVSPRMLEISDWNVSLTLGSCRRRLLRFTGKFQTLQNKALSLITFAYHLSSIYQHHVDIYMDFRLLKLMDLVTLKNLLFDHDYFNKKFPMSFADYFILSRVEV